MNPKHKSLFFRASLVLSKLWSQREGKSGINVCLAELLAVFFSGCGQQCPVSVELKFNDLGLPFLVQLTNLTDGKIAIEKVLVNGEENLTQYMVGLFQKAGRLPVELSKGEVASFLVFPYSGQKRIASVLVVADGQEWEVSFAAY